jgi:hypothetical protein
LRCQIISGSAADGAAKAGYGFNEWQGGIGLTVKGGTKVTRVFRLLACWGMLYAGSDCAGQFCAGF